jgi:NitT/TauT family transport system substrate-binding protein
MFKISAWMRQVGLALAALTLTIACTQQPKTNTPTNPGTSPSSAPPAAQSKPLVSTTLSWIGYSSHYIAVKKGLFKEAGLNVEDLFLQNSTDIFTAFTTKKADIAWMNTADAVQLAEKDPSLKIIYVVDYSNGADAIIGRDIKTPQELKGKTVARENILLPKILLNTYLSKGGLTERDLKIKNIDAAGSGTAFAAKQVDAAVTFEPYLSKAVKQGGGTILFSSKNTNLIGDVVVVHEDLIKTRKADLQAFLKAIDKGVALVNAGDSEALKISGDKMGVSVDDVREQLMGVKIFDVAGNKSIAFNKNNPNNIMKNLELTTKTAKESKLVKNPVDPKTLYDASIVQSL